MAVNFSKNQDEITKAWRDVVDSTNTPKWALFGYEGMTNIIKLMSTGSRGLDELVDELNCSLIQYAFCRVIDEQLGINKLVLINWQGDSSPLSRKGLCASHVGDVSNYFKGCGQTITIRNDDEATREYLMDQIIKTSASRVSLVLQQNTTNKMDVTEPVSSTYKKAQIGTELTSDRKSFWQRQEEEEKQRIAEEKLRAAEKQAQFERERKLREESEAKKLAETIQERSKFIDATRQADSRSKTDSQPSSIPSSSSNDLPDDDSQVGRRSELLRLERNQETQSLISKGLIKNKRAIFEQAQQQQQQSQQPTLVRRASGAIITQRVNTFKSLDNPRSVTSSGNNQAKNVDQLANGFAKQVKLGGDSNSISTAAAAAVPVKKEVEVVILSRDDAEQHNTKEATAKSHKVPDAAPVAESLPINEADKNSTTKENGAKVINVTQDVNGNNEQESINKQEEAKTTEIGANEDQPVNGESGIKAIAMYDYQAADNTEISFDPEDIIGSILKVDPGWWHGKVVSGRFEGQVGLFPANYVQEL